MPDETLAKRLAWVDPTMRTVEQEQFCSWSAWTTKKSDRADTAACTGS